MSTTHTSIRGLLLRRRTFLLWQEASNDCYPRIIDNPKRRVNRIRNSLFQLLTSTSTTMAVLSTFSFICSSQALDTFRLRAILRLRTKYNEIKVTLQNSKGPVRSSSCHVRNGNTGYYSRVKELDNSDVILRSTSSLQTMASMFRLLMPTLKLTPFPKGLVLRYSQTTGCSTRIM